MRANRFLERSVHGFLRVLEHTLESEELTRRAGFLQGLCERLGAPSRQRDRVAFLQQREGRGLADPRARAGYDRDLVRHALS